MLARRRRSLVAAAVVLFVGAGLALAVRHYASPTGVPSSPASAAQPAAAAGLAVVVAPARMSPLSRSVSGDGSIVAWQELVVGAEAGGLRVAELLVEEGDRVTKGQVMVRLEDAVVSAQRDQAEAAVAEAEAALRIAEQELDRSVELSRTQAIARQTVDQRQAVARQAEARLAAARARLEEATARHAQTRVRAPEDGVVLRRSALPGAVTAVGQDMVRLLRDNRLELDARVPELELAALRAGNRARVTHGERSLDAEVRAIAPLVAAETRLGIVHIALPPESGLRPGMFATVEIFPDSPPGLTVPLEAVVFQEGRPVVFVLSDDDATVAGRGIRTGRRQAGLVEVTDGLREGERVVVVGAGFLSDGDRVAPTSAIPFRSTATR